MAMKEQNLVTLHALGDEVTCVSSDLDSPVEKLAIKHYAPPGTRLLSKEQFRQWTTKKTVAESGVKHSHTRAETAVRADGSVG